MECDSAIVDLRDLRSNGSSTKAISFKSDARSEAINDSWSTLISLHTRQLASPCTKSASSFQ